MKDHFSIEPGKTNITIIFYFFFIPEMETIFLEQLNAAERLSQFVDKVRGRQIYRDFCFCRIAFSVCVTLFIEESRCI
jgi:hypothetical protein